jgi:small subunit ribosomal protein S18
MNYWNQKKTSQNSDKKRTNWNQSLRSNPNSKPRKPKKLKKSLQYLFLLKKYHNIVDYKNIKLLKAFLTKYGKIRPRRKTKISLQKQHQIAKAIRKSRALGLIPFICNVNL